MTLLLKNSEEMKVNIRPIYSKKKKTGEGKDCSKMFVYTMTVLVINCCWSKYLTISISIFIDIECT